MEGRRGQVSERTLQDNLSVMKMNPLFIVSALNRYIKDFLVVSGQFKNDFCPRFDSDFEQSKSVARIPHNK